MDRSLIHRLRTHVLIWTGIAVMAALAVVALLNPSTSRIESTQALAAEPAEIPDATRDTELQQWAIEAPETMPEPQRAPEEPPAPEVDWNALAVGVASVSVSQDVSLSLPADVYGTLSSEQTRTLIAAGDAEAAGAGRGRLPGFVGAVVARGTPSGGGDCTPTSW